MIWVYYIIEFVCVCLFGHVNRGRDCGSCDQKKREEMGRGAMLRNVGRAIGARGVGVGAVVTSPTQQASCSACRSSSSSVAKVRASACVCEQERGIATQQTLANQHCWQLDDWEFAGDEEGFETHYHDNDHDRLIFGSVPTQKEVQEAVSDLQDALTQGIVPVSGNFNHKAVLSSSSSVHKISDSLEVSTIHGIGNKSCGTLVNLDKVERESHEDNYRIVQKAGHDSVCEAFNLLQSNPAVQEMVISLASDKAVWEALLKNEKVAEFRQSLEGGESKLRELSKDSDKPPPHQENAFMQAIENTKLKVMQCIEKITEVLNQYFRFAIEKNLFEKDEDPLERILKGSLMLSVAVLLVILVKRV